MLILDRYKEQSIVIGSPTTAHIELTADDLSGIRNGRTETLIDIAQRLFASMGQITIKVVYARRGLAKLGMTAPKVMRIDREEVAIQRAAQEENQT